MAYRKTRQYKREQRFLVELWFCTIILFLVGFLFSVSAINHAFTLSHWNTNGILDYTGGYTLSEHDYLRNTCYIFTLNNGDVISVPSEHLHIGNFSDHQALSFRYSKCKSVFRMGTHDVISIETPGENNQIQYVNVTQTGYQSALTLYTILGIVCLLLFVAFLSFILYSSKTSKRKRKTNN